MCSSPPPPWEWLDQTWRALSRVPSTYWWRPLQSFFPCLCFSMHASSSLFLQNTEMRQSCEVLWSLLSTRVWIKTQLKRDITGVRNSWLTKKGESCVTSQQSLKRYPVQAKLYLEVTNVHLFTGSLPAAGPRLFFIVTGLLQFQTLCKHVSLIMCQLKSILFPDYTLCPSVRPLVPHTVLPHPASTCCFFGMFPCACILVSSITSNTYRFNLYNWNYAINVSGLSCGLIYIVPCTCVLLRSVAPFFLSVYPTPL